jgi:NAD(P)-dependent dehydrogenase (short-subunit alcohol dehydrogenase family)
VDNASVALGGQFRQLTLEEFDWVLRVNFRAALTHYLLPALLRSLGSHVVNVSRLVTPRRQSAYVASKFALRGKQGRKRRTCASRCSRPIANDQIVVASSRDGGLT